MRGNWPVLAGLVQTRVISFLHHNYGLWLRAWQTPERQPQSRLHVAVVHLQCKTPNTTNRTSSKLLTWNNSDEWAEAGKHCDLNIACNSLYNRLHRANVALDTSRRRICSIIKSHCQQFMMQIVFRTWTRRRFFRCGLWLYIWLYIYIIVCSRQSRILQKMIIIILSNDNVSF